MNVSKSLRKWGLGFLVAASAALAGSQAQAYTVSLTPAAQTVDEGALVAVEVRVSDLGPLGLGSYNFDLGFDAAILGFDRVVDAFGLGDALGLDVTLNGGSLLVSDFSLDDPLVLLTRQGADVTLFTMYFNAIGVGTSALTLNSGILSDVNGDIVSFLTGNATVTVLEQIGGEVPAPGTLALLLAAGFAAAIAWRRAGTHG